MWWPCLKQNWAHEYNKVNKPEIANSTQPWGTTGEVYYHLVPPSTAGAKVYRKGTYGEVSTTSMREVCIWLRFHIVQKLFIVVQTNVKIQKQLFHIVQKLFIVVQTNVKIQKKLGLFLCKYERYSDTNCFQKVIWKVALSRTISHRPKTVYTRPNKCEKSKNSSCCCCASRSGIPTQTVSKKCFERYNMCRGLCLSHARKPRNS